MRSAAVAAGFSMLIVGHGLAADHLEVSWPSLPVSLNIAAARMDLAPIASFGDCHEGASDPCHWEAPGGVDVLASSDGNGHLERIEAAWNAGGSRRDTPFRSACAILVSLISPARSKAQVSAILSKTMVIGPSHQPDVERRQIVDGYELFGERNVPSERNTKDAAYLQCIAKIAY